MGQGVNSQQGRSEVKKNIRPKDEAQRCQKRKSQNMKNMEKIQKGTTGARTQVPIVIGARFYHWVGYTPVY